MKNSSSAVSLKRRTVLVAEPQMPTKSLFTDNFEELKTHRTAHKSISCPQDELQSYKRKDFSTLNEISPKKESEILDPQTGCTKASVYKKLFPKGLKSELSPYASFMMKQSSNSISPFEYNYASSNDHNESLANQNFPDSSRHSTKPINSLDQHHIQEENLRVKFEGSVFSKEQNQSTKIEGSQPNAKSELGQNLEQKLERNQEKLQNRHQSVDWEEDVVKSSNAGRGEEDDNQTEENFDDYEFGGAEGTNPIINGMIAAKSIAKLPRAKRKKLLAPPAVPSYTTGVTPTEKPSNWRSSNHYVPGNEAENRMAQQHIANQQTSLQLRREQQQIARLIHEYQQNKRSINKQSQRKVETNRIMEKIYKQRRSLSGNGSVSLPHLKAPYPKREIILSEIAEQPKAQVSQPIVENLLSKCLDEENPKRQHSVRAHIKQSSSSSKLGFGTQQQRKLYPNDVYEAEIENIEKIQKKFRQKGIPFNGLALRKGLINNREFPTYPTAQTQNQKLKKREASRGQTEGVLELPEKELMSNAYYKVFPI